MENNVSVFATKADLFALKESLSADIFAVKEDLAKVEGRLSEKIASSDSRTMKWMFLFWVGQMTAIILLYLKK